MATLARQLKRRERSIEQSTKKACAFKIRHPNLFTAMRHCVEIQDKRLNLDPQNLDAPVMFYHCDDCGFAHVGHLGRGESYLMYGPYSENIRELQR
jgi:rubrerythrin